MTSIIQQNVSLTELWYVDDTLPSICVSKQQPTTGGSIEGGQQFVARVVGNDKGGGQWHDKEEGLSTSDEESTSEIGGK